MAAQRSRQPSDQGGAAMGVTAGMIPCPEAFGVLLLAIGLQRTALGLLMIVAFSEGWPRCSSGWGSCW
jgi:nickel/cobalt transporter (NicO) family protein